MAVAAGRDAAVGAANPPAANPPAAAHEAADAPQPSAPGLAGGPTAGSSARSRPAHDLEGRSGQVCTSQWLLVLTAPAHLLAGWSGLTV